jgi:hypothetical protein
MLRVFGARHVAKALGGDGADRRERVFDAMMKLFQDQFLQLVGCLTLTGVYAGLSQQTLGIDFGLRHQQPKAGILCFQKAMRRRPIRRLAFLMMIGLKHRWFYHHKSGAAHTFDTLFELQSRVWDAFSAKTARRA